MSFPDELETPRCRLRLLAEGDVEAVAAHFGDEQVAEFLDQSRLQTLDEAREIVEWARRLHAAGRGVRWAITERGSGRFIGTCGFHGLAPEGHRVEVGFDLAPARWGTGLMAEVLGAALDVAFTKLALRRVEAHVTPGNARSCRRLESLGFSREGVLREHAFWDGRTHDQVVYSLLAREWRELRSGRDRAGPSARQ